MQRLEQRWRNYGIELPVERVNLHYLNGAVDVEIILDLEAMEDIEGARRLSRQLADATRGEPLVGQVNVFYL